jgi:hypothetical protein
MNNTVCCKCGDLAAGREGFASKQHNVHILAKLPINTCWIGNLYKIGDMIAFACKYIHFIKILEMCGTQNR